MQTLLPYPDFTESAKVLDTARLGPQCVQVTQILDALLEVTDRYRNHPVTQMWTGCEMQLAEFGLVCCEEWANRGFSNELTMPKLQWQLEMSAENDNMGKPEWFGRPEIHDEYKGLLVWHDSSHYGKIFPGIEPIKPVQFRYPTDF